MVARSGVVSNRYGIEKLGAAWRDFGADLSFDLSVNFGLCVVDGCAGMSFVGLRTEGGPLPVCLKHYDVILEQSERVPAA